MLKAHGFSLASDHVDQMAFGNRSVVYIALGFAVRFVRDRGDAFVHVACCPSPSRWYMLPRLLEYLGLDRESRFTSWDERAFRAQGEALDRNYDRIQSFCQRVGLAQGSGYDGFADDKADERFGKFVQET
jgi:hypothetical protein